MAASHAIAMGPALLRRYCSCDFTRACSCGEDPPKSGWTVEGLTTLQTLMKEHRSLLTVALLIGKTQRDCNLALDALFRRSPTHALAVLEARAARR